MANAENSDPRLNAIIDQDTLLAIIQQAWAPSQEEFSRKISQALGQVNGASSAQQQDTAEKDPAPPLPRINPQPQDEPNTMAQDLAVMTEMCRRLKMQMSVDERRTLQVITDRAVNPIDQGKPPQSLPQSRSPPGRKQNREDELLIEFDPVTQAGLLKNHPAVDNEGYSCGESSPSSPVYRQYQHKGKENRRPDPLHPHHSDRYQPAGTNRPSYHPRPHGRYFQKEEAGYESSDSPSHAPAELLRRYPHNGAPRRKSGTQNRSQQPFFQPQSEQKNQNQHYAAPMNNGTFVVPDVRPAIQPKVFNIEEGGSFKRFFLSFEEFCLAEYKSTQASWLPELERFLTGRALEALRSIQTGDDTYSNVKAQLLDYFKAHEKGKKKTNRYKFHKARMLEAEDPTIYPLRLEKLYREAYPDDDANSSPLLVDKFIETTTPDLRDPVHMAVLIDKSQNRETTWSTVKTMVSNIAMVDRQRTKMKKVREHDSLPYARALIAMPAESQPQPPKVYKAERERVPQPATRVPNQAPQTNQQSNPTAAYKPQMSDRRETRNPNRPVSSHQRRPSSSDRCHYCDVPGHGEHQCWRKLGLCLGCGSPQHYVAQCPDQRPRTPRRSFGAPQRERPMRPRSQGRDQRGYDDRFDDWHRTFQDRPHQRPSGQGNRNVQRPQRQGTPPPPHSARRESSSPQPPRSRRQSRQASRNRPPTSRNSSRQSNRSRRDTPLNA